MAPSSSSSSAPSSSSSSSSSSSFSQSSLPPHLSSSSSFSNGLAPRRPLPLPPDDLSSKTFHASSSAILQQQQDSTPSPSPFASDSFLSFGHAAPHPRSSSIRASSSSPPHLHPLHTSSSSASSSIPAPAAFLSPLHHRHPTAPKLPTPPHQPFTNPDPDPNQGGAWRPEAASGFRARGVYDEGSRSFCMPDPWRRSFTSPATAYGVGGYGGNAPLERGLYHPVFDFCNSDDHYSSPFMSAINSHRDLFATDQVSPLMRYSRFLAAQSPSAMGALGGGGGGGGYGDDNLENLLCAASSSARMVGKSQSMRALYEENAALRRALYSIRSGSGGGGFNVDSQGELGSDRRIASDSGEGRATSMREGGRWAAKDWGNQHWPWMGDSSSEPQNVMSEQRCCRGQCPWHDKGLFLCDGSTPDLHLSGSGRAPVQQLHQLFSREAEERRKAAIGEKSGVQCAMCGGDLAPPPASGATQSLPLRLCSACQPAATPGGPAAASSRHLLSAAISIACRPSAAGKSSAAAHKRPRPRFLDLCRHFVGFSAAK